MLGKLDQFGQDVPFNDIQKVALAFFLISHNFGIIDQLGANSVKIAFLVIF